jgi:fructose-1,6-bisphosphatase/inositol monophosphatase family enzyme
MWQVGIYPWDVCAGAVIVEEAAGVCMDTMGGDFDLTSRGSAKLDCSLFDG